MPSRIRIVRPSNVALLLRVRFAGSGFPGFPVSRRSACQSLRGLKPRRGQLLIDVRRGLGLPGAAKQQFPGKAAKRHPFGGFPKSVRFVYEALLKGLLAEETATTLARLAISSPIKVRDGR